jgi:hypothetical protein
MKVYPYFQGKENIPKYKNIKCKFCSNKATQKVIWQINCFRGDDEVFFTCKDHQNKNPFPTSIV